MDNTPITLLISPQEAGLPIAELLRQEFGATLVELPLARGGVWLDGRRVLDTSLPATPGARLTLYRPPTGQYAEVELQQGDILYEDGWLLALNKHAEWYSGAVPWDTQGNTLAALARFLLARDDVPPYLHLAHQLDRGTSGVLLFSRCPAANGPLQHTFALQAAHKVYHCICVGVPDSAAFELRTGHGRERGGRFRLYPLDQVGAPLPGGGRVKLAHTQFIRLRHLAAATLIQAVPLTGRSHQIRLHLASIGHPLLGDARYGGPAHYLDQPLPYHLLHAASLEVAHPHTGAPLRIEAPTPSFFLTTETQGCA